MQSPAPLGEVALGAHRAVGARASVEVLAILAVLILRAVKCARPTRAFVLSAAADEEIPVLALVGT